MTLTSKQRSHLRGLAHHLSPVVQVGQNGISHAVVRQVEQQLATHELIKVQVSATGAARRAAGRELADEVSAELVQVIGRIVVLYKAHPEEPQIRLPRPTA